MSPEGDGLERFAPATREWFRGAFDRPTAVQRGAWNAISAGNHTLVVAPTGSGKTLAAFLWAIDRLAAAEDDGALIPPIPRDVGPSKRHRATSVVYLSPLKALGVDVERNLRSPLVGITQTARRMGVDAPAVTVGVRSGDTSASDRRALLREPPDILITTPESLYLMLTSQARSTLSEVATVILDEVHAVASTKRGSHLALTLERLDALLERPAQRIGLSATVRPLDEIARFLAGDAPVEIVAPGSEKRFDLLVEVPVDDLSDIGSATPRRGGPSDDDDPVFGSAAQSLRDPDDTPAGSIWPHIEESIVDRVLDHRSTIVFVNSRRLAERLTARLNEIYEERLQAAEDLGDLTVVEDEVEDENARAGRGEHGTSDPAAAPFTTDVPTADPPITIDDAGDAPLGGPVNWSAGFGPGRPAPRDPDRPTPRHPPAMLIGGSGQSGGADPVLARAHHGSVSKEARAEVEEALKSGRLRCVVATSSLELGIDMGDVELVIQVESPPSVSSGLQRVGRAGHQVGVVSEGVFYPKHRADVLHSSVAAARMVAGRIERMSIIANPLDVLAQQTVAAASVDELDVEEWFDLVRRSAPFASLSRPVFDATLDLLAGRYPSDQFSELRPRIVWDRDRGVLQGRQGAQRLAVTSGGTIPDRGLFGVFLLASSDGDAPGVTDEGASTPAARRGGMRVGELDEEMVYESRVGDVFALGTTSWRIAEITHDRVLVTPAFGEPGRLPFWVGDALGRPAELGEAIGAITRGIDRAIQAAGQGGPPSRDDGRDPRVGFLPDDLAAITDDRAAGNLVEYVREQRDATGQVPSDTTLVVERFRDELGDWRLVLHSPYGTPVHAPWALMVSARVNERFGLDGAAVANDDGIVVRIPEGDAEPPGAELFVFEPDEVEAIVSREVGGSALFASRFREAAARALLLPRLHPGKRSPLWQQRQKAAQLLDVARTHPTFPIILETVREVLHDVYDLDALQRLTSRIARREVRIVDVQTEQASPFARTILFGYVGAFMYEGDSPLAERRAAALALDPALLADLLGRVELRELLDADVIARVELELQRLAPGRQARDLEGVADLLRVIGPLSANEIAARLEDPDAEAPSTENAAAECPHAESHEPDTDTHTDTDTDTIDADHTVLADDAGPEPASARSAAATPQPPSAEHLARAESIAQDLVSARRALRVRIGGEWRFAAIEDASRLRDAVGVALPIGVPVAFVEPVADPVGDLVSRYARTHGPFTIDAAADRLALGRAVVRETLTRLELARRVVQGEFRPDGTGTEWVDAEVLRRIRARSLAALRSEIEPVEQSAYARFLPTWQHVGGTLRGVDGVVTVVDQLAGVPVPASAWESLVLPARVTDYSPVLLDELTASGELVWRGHGSIAGGDGWVSLHLSDTAPLTLPAEPEGEPDALGERIVELLAGGGAMFFRQLADALGHSDDGVLADAIWELVWQGRLTNDTLAPLRALLSGGAGTASKSAHRTASRAARGRLYRGRVGTPAQQAPSRLGPPRVSGRWSLVPTGEHDATARAHAAGDLLLDRYGVVTRGAVMAEELPGGFALAYRVLSRFEESGRARRGYFVERLGAAQFSTAGAVDRLRTFTREPGDERRALEAVTLASTDPATPFGAALAWPEPPESDGTRHRPARRAGGLVTIVDGALVLYVERGGKTLLTFERDDDVLRAAAASLAETVGRARIPNFVIEKADGEFVLGHDLGTWLQEAGFSATPRGLRLRVR
ncbi:DEAD/DEAH box helicase [Pseudoclavibacter chungangensis]|uniref:DEAD/DEAH box helicase n=1 Tax=Pseudoclavibacter chungangensis TaxID=587635 RepID=A0A7J5C1M1_9MICO|nr:DEAD/DEAH box helicase [Pseudoclavibacter chungangensis]